MWFVLFAKSNFIEKKEWGINVHGSRIYQAQKTFNISNRDDRESQEYPYIWICMNAPLIKSNSSYVYIFQCLFTTLVPCCDVCSYFCRKAHVLFTLFVFVCVLWCSTHIVLCFLFCLSSFGVANVSSFSGLSILEWAFGFLWCLFVT